jgi:hypothetical protein
VPTPDNRWYAELLNQDGSFYAMLAKSHVTHY